MSDQNFDKRIRQSLEHFEDPFDAGSWDTLQQRMEQRSGAADAPTPLSEEQLANTLRQVEPAYEPAHWSLLSKRLDQVGRIRRIRIHKSAEAVLLLLLLLNLQAFLQGGAKLFHMPPPHTPVEQAPPAAMALHKNKAEPKGTLGTACLLPGIIVQDTDTTLIRLLAAQMTQIANDETLMVQAIIPFDPNTSNTGGFASAVVGPDGMPIPKGLSPLSLLAALGMDDFEQTTHAPSLALSVTPVLRKQKDARQQYVQLFAAYNHNRTEIPEQALRSSNGQAQAGLMYGVRRGKWGAEAGVAYTQLNYQTGKEIIRFAQDPTQGYVGTSLNDVSANMVSVPVRVTRQVAKAGKTRAVLTAGSTAHVATRKKYGFKDYAYPQPPSSSGPTPALPVARGAAQKGSLSDNFYATADLGLRIEQPINRRVTAFVEPVYKRSIAGNGLSPQQARTHTASVQAGLLAIL